MCRCKTYLPGAEAKPLNHSFSWAMNPSFSFLFLIPKWKVMTMSRKCKRYGLRNFIFDIIMICITGGLWLIWIFVREMRNR